MFFKRKYVFESIKTKTFRRGLNIGLFFICCFILYSLLCAGFIGLAKNETKLSNSLYYKKHPDLIVVFTGDSGRIPLALLKAKEYGQSHILISGVGGGNTITSLVTTDEAQMAIGKIDNIDTNLLDIDYMAKNTFENVIETLRYLKANPNMKKILIISHDYHIARIMMLFKLMKPQHVDYDVNYHAVMADYTKLRNIKILYKEIFKLVRNYAMVLLWE